MNAAPTASYVSTLKLYVCSEDEYGSDWERIVSVPDVLGGEPVFRGTRLPLQHVASLFRKGLPEKEIADDFPALSVPDLRYARLFSRLSERPLQPRKGQRLRGDGDKLRVPWAFGELREKRIFVQ
jgi:uncharacterized protein (DUF433 family)